MKITEFTISPTLQPKLNVIGSVEGDFNVLSSMFSKLTKSFDRQKISYIYKVENAPANYYKFSLSTKEYNIAKILIPDIDEVH